MRGVIAVMVASLMATPAGGVELGFGDPAPRLQVGGWVKGEPIDGFEPGKTYLVEFWATWCQPCIENMPHLTALQERYRDQGLEVVGVSVMEHDFDAVGPFVERMGEKMGYRVAVDRVSSVTGGGMMASSWMRASGNELLPTAFLVRDGTIQWIGHPALVDEPLARLLAGTYDLQEARAADLRRKELDRKEEALDERLGKLRGDDYRGALAVIDRAIAEEPGLEGRYWYPKFQFLLLTGARDEAIAYGESAVGGVLKDDPAALGDFAWALVDPQGQLGLGDRGVGLALKAAGRANELVGGADSHLLDTLARARFLGGDLKGAVDAQREAVAKLPGPNPSYADRLADYERALARRGR